MKLFEVCVTVTFHDILAVHANDDDHAAAVASAAVAHRMGAWQPYMPGMPSLDPGVKNGPVDPEVRTATQVCLTCGCSAAKELWGPGWMKCPNPKCGRRPVSAGEVFGMLQLLVDAADPANLAPTLKGIAEAETAGYTVAVAAARAKLVARGLAS
jgi:hypothetical protein